MEIKNSCSFWVSSFLYSILPNYRSYKHCMQCKTNVFTVIGMQGAFCTSLVAKASFDG